MGHHQKRKHHTEGKDDAVRKIVRPFYVILLSELHFQTTINTDREIVIMPRNSRIHNM